MWNNHRTQARDADSGAECGAVGLGGRGWTGVLGRGRVGRGWALWYEWDEVGWGGVVVKICPGEKKSAGGVIG